MYKSDTQSRVEYRRVFGVIFNFPWDPNAKRPSIFVYKFCGCLNPSSIHMYRCCISVCEVDCSVVWIGQYTMPVQSGSGSVALTACKQHSL